MRRWLGRQIDRLRQASRERKIEARSRLKARYHLFRSLLAANNRAVDLLTEIGIHLRMEGDPSALVVLSHRLIKEIGEMIAHLDTLAEGRYRGLSAVHQRVSHKLREALGHLAEPASLPLVLPLTGIHRGLASQTGNKAASLAQLRQSGLPVPDGFVIPLTACRFFLEHAGLSRALVRLLAGHGAGGGERPISAATASRVQELITGAEIPAALAEEILKAADPFLQSDKGLAVRSSSISEDGSRHSFAGQFSSVLNVRDRVGFLEAFKEVVASNFNQRSLAYRVHAGLDPLRFDMAVLCLEMVDARAAGVLLTRSPQNPASGLMLLSAVPGLGEAAVAGSAAADLYLLDADGAVDWSQSSIALKERFLTGVETGGVAWRELPLDARSRPVLTQEELRTLARWGRELEERHGTPLDLEWAVDHLGSIIILQARPMTSSQISDSDEHTASSPPLLEGTIASGGRASGRVLLVQSRKDLAQIPLEPVVLVMHQSFVEAAAVLAQAAAVLVELGTPADHLACVAREQEIPMICGLRDATKLLHKGQWLTIDGSRGRVYEACEEEIAAAREIWKAGPPADRLRPPLSPIFRELQELLTDLHLTDAYGPTFSIAECASLHDIVRFVHEKAVLSMFRAGDELLDEDSGGVHVVDAPVPFFVSVVDMGGGIASPETQKKRIPPEAVISRPFQALWQGITTPGLNWGPPPGGAPMGSVMSSFITDQKSERPIGMPNYALVSRDYCNMNARMDFHFIMIDAVASISPRSNHIKFRFKGGGTNLERRRRRALCISRIFEHYGFSVDVREDLVTASLQGAERTVIEEKLVMVGTILGFTRLLDAAMGDDTMIDAVACAFMDGDYGLSQFRRDGSVAPVAPLQ